MPIQIYKGTDSEYAIRINIKKDLYILVKDGGSFEVGTESGTVFHDPP